MKTTHFNILNIAIVLVILSISCNQQKKEKEQIMQENSKEVLKTISADNFRTVVNGDSTQLYTLRNNNGVRALFTNYGQRLVALYVPDKNGRLDDVVLGFPNLQGFIASAEPYFGATIGRFGNRIADAKFTLDGTTYKLAKNNGPNTLHGGPGGFHHVVWATKQLSDNQIEFTRTSPDMEEGFPGNLLVTVSYTLTDDNELDIRYTATTDKKTVINLTHHSFFNLAGEGNGDINNHILTINADTFTPVDSTLIPTGELRLVEGTAFDFRIPKPIGKDVNEKDAQLSYGQGYDHNFVLNNGPLDDKGLRFAAKVLEPNSGRTMEIYTNEPGLQFYGGNFLDGKAIGKTGKPYVYRGAFCLETQHFPDSPNQPNFPSTVLVPGETYSSICIYKFAIQKD